jgi:hypothetical protein
VGLLFLELDILEREIAEEALTGSYVGNQEN